MKARRKSTGSVQFPLKEPLPKELIREMIRYRLDTFSGN